MTEKITNIMIPDNEAKIDIEKLVIWGLRKHDYVYKHVKVGDDLVVNMVFHFVLEHETPISYKDIVGEFKEPEYKTTQELITSSGTSTKAPNNTMLFKHWANENQIKQFTLQSFTSANVGITREQAIKIVTHQIHKKTIIQLDNDTFKIVKEL